MVNCNICCNDKTSLYNLCNICNNSHICIDCINKLIKLNENKRLKTIDLQYKCPYCRNINMNIYNHIKSLSNDIFKHFLSNTIYEFNNNFRINTNNVISNLDRVNKKLITDNKNLKIENDNLKNNNNINVILQRDEYKCIVCNKILKKTSKYTHNKSKKHINNQNIINQNRINQNRSNFVD